MNSVAINQLAILNVYQVKHDESRIDIHFTLNGEPYSVLVSKIEHNTFEPVFVYHESREYCAVCENKPNDFLTFCKGLEKHLNELFHRLIEYPGIRLEWLFFPTFPHVSQIEEE